MVRRIFCCLLLVACLSQAWTASAMPMVGSDDATQQDCAGHMDAGDEGCDCCPDGAPAGAACESVCGASAAVLPSVVEPVVTLGAAPVVLAAAVRAGPRYIPLNPPPIA